MAECEKVFSLLKLNVTAKIENFFKKHVYSGGFLANDTTERLFEYGEASRACYKVGNQTVIKNPKMILLVLEICKQRQIVGQFFSVNSVK